MDSFVHFSTSNESQSAIDEECPGLPLTKNVLAQLAKSVLIPLELAAAA